MFAGALAGNFWSDSFHTSQLVCGAQYQFSTHRLAVFESPRRFIKHLRCKRECMQRCTRERYGCCFSSYFEASSGFLIPYPHNRRSYLTSEGKPQQLLFQSACERKTTSSPPLREKPYICFCAVPENLVVLQWFQ